MQTIALGRVPFLDLKTQVSKIRSEVLEAITGVVDRCDFVLGPDVAEFEREFASYCEVEAAIGVDSGFSALELALRAAGIGPGDEVITQANTFIATVGAILAIGATPVLVEPAPDGAFDAEHAAAAVTRRTRALLPVHLFGRVAQMADTLAVAEQAGAVVIEDACQAHGARIDGRRAGSFGFASAFSFYPGKNLGAFGDAGIVTTNSKAIADQVRVLRNIGQRVKYVHEVGPPLNRRLDTIQATVLRIKLRHLEDWNRARMAVADRYRAHLAGVDLVLPEPGPTGSHVYHLFVVTTPHRDALRQALEGAGIETGIHYPIPPHLQPALSSLGYKAGAFPVTERLANESLSLPMYPELTEEQIDRVSAAVRDFLGDD